MYISASAPEAPPLRETTIGCFSRLFFWTAACIILAIWSDAPPAPAATTISTGLLGSHASAADVFSTRAASALATQPISLLMSSLLFDFRVPAQAARRAGALAQSERYSIAARTPSRLTERWRARGPFPRRRACPSARGR